MKQLLAALTIVTFAPVPARAHFVWIVPDQSGSSAQVVFSETPQPDDPALLGKIAKTKVFVRFADGKEVPRFLTKGKDSYQVSLPGTGPRLVGGICNYGVLQKGDAEPFLLIYQAKALVSTDSSHKLATTPWSKLPFEIVNPQGKFQLLFQGKPLAGAEVFYSAPGQEPPEKTTTDKSGTFDLGSFKGGLCGILAKHVDKTPGEQDGKKYKEVRHYTTLVLQVADRAEKRKKLSKLEMAEADYKSAVMKANSAALKAKTYREIYDRNRSLPSQLLWQELDISRATWLSAEFEAAAKQQSVAEAHIVFEQVQLNLDQQKPADAVKPDPQATKLLADALAARANWEKFPGFSADVDINIDGKLSKGKVTVAATGKVSFEKLDPEAEAWAKRSLGSVVAHRIDDSTSLNTPCAFADDDVHHPLGRAIRVLNDELHSSYRVRGREIIVVNRQMKGQRFSITVLENRVNKEDKYLPDTYVVHYWDTKSGDLQRTEAHSQTWTRVDGIDLPATAYVITATKNLATRRLTLSNHQVAK